jgi:hypothetical protein
MSDQIYIEHENYKDFNKQGEYKKTCDSCKKIHTVFTQADRYPEYSTTVIVICDCGADIAFLLPVN